MGQTFELYSAREGAAYLSEILVRYDGANDGCDMGPELEEVCEAGRSLLPKADSTSDAVGTAGVRLRDVVLKGSAETVIRKALAKLNDGNQEGAPR